MERKSGTPVEWAVALLFVFAAGYTTWNMPKLILGFGWGTDALAARYPAAGPIEYAALVAIPILFVIGLYTIHLSRIEYDSTGGFDRVSLFIGRVTMLLIALIVTVMFYEVVLRYVFERPTLWANELSLWMAGFVFLLAGLYAMQQRSHIRIYIIYDMMPRPVRKLCDVVSVILIVIFAAAMIWGGYNEATSKFLRWETFGTAFDPPIPATLKPLILVFMPLIAIQAISNLILDWNKAPEHHDPGEEAEELKAQIKGDA